MADITEIDSENRPLTYSEALDKVRGILAELGTAAQFRLVKELADQYNISNIPWIGMENWG